MDLKVEILPALNDNYIYLIHDTVSAIVIDPGEARGVEHFLTDHNLSLDGIVVTHHHTDHIGGVLPLKEKYGALVYAPLDGEIPRVDMVVGDGDIITIGFITFQIIHTPGHTMGHVVYFAPQQKWLFSGDTLFGGGCGKLFEGSASEMYGSFLKLGELDPNTQVYCGHENTKTNLAFAHSIEPTNALVAERLERVQNMGCTIPFTLRDEFSTNPYFRVDDDSLRRVLNMSGASSTEVFAEIRRRKDEFTPR